MAEYVVYPGGTNHYSLKSANATAKRVSQDEGVAYVENRDTGRQVAEWSDGVKERKNPKQPHKRVRKALTKYVRGTSNNPLGLPTQYTNAKVRVDSKGEIDIKFPGPPKGTLRNPKRFKVTRKK